MKRGKASLQKKKTASLQRWLGSDLICDPRPSAHGGGGEGTEAQTPRRGEKVITLPLLLICGRQRASGAEADAKRRPSRDFVSAALRRDLPLSEKNIKRKRGRLAGSCAVTTIRETPPPRLPSAGAVLVRPLCHMAPWLR